MRNEMATSARWRPVVYVAVQDRACRARIIDALHAQGCAVVERATGFHVIQSIAEIIEGAHAWSRPGLIVIDAVLRGCLGTTIAEGLRELGVHIPIVLVTRPGERPPIPEDRMVRVVDAARAPSVAVELTRAGAAVRARTVDPRGPAPASHAGLDGQGIDPTCCA